MCAPLNTQILFTVGVQRSRAFLAATHFLLLFRAFTTKNQLCHECLCLLRGHSWKLLWLYHYRILFSILFQSKLADLLAFSVEGSVLTAGLERLCLLSDASFWRGKRLKDIFFLIFLFFLISNQWPNSNPG